jgi:type IV pilus assembly protein PilV
MRTLTRPRTLADTGLPAKQSGVALLEVAVSVLVISIGVLGLAGLQIAAKRAGYEALQRTTASALANDIIERMRGNPTQLDSYNGANVGAVTNITDASGQNCAAGCTAEELAARDLWEWEQAITGATEVADPNDAAVAVGGLVQATGCIAVVDGTVEVTISWEGYQEMSVVNAGNDCGGNEGSASRQLLVVETFITDGA